MESSRSCEQSYLANTDGSCLYREGNTSVLVSVRGPKDVPARKELLDKSLIEVEVRNSFGISGISDREREIFVKNSIESFILATLHPRTSISIVIHVLKEDGSVLSAIINATCIALMDAGIPMKALFCSCTCALLSPEEEENTRIIIDPTKKQEDEARCSFVFVKDNVSENEESFVSTYKLGDSTFDLEEYSNCFSYGTQGCRRVLQFYRASAEQKYKKLSQ